VRRIWLKKVYFDRSLVEGEAWRFSSNFARPPSCERRAIERFNPFIFIRNECRVIYSEAFSALEITPLYVLRGLCCPSRQEQQPAAD
jgi:hypothetical protein